MYGATAAIVGAVVGAGLGYYADVGILIGAAVGAAAGIYIQAARELGVWNPVVVIPYIIGRLTAGGVEDILKNLGGDLKNYFSGDNIKGGFQEIGQDIKGWFHK